MTKGLAVYMRVSTSKQDTISQQRAIDAYLDHHRLEPEHWFEDRVSGRDFARPEFRKLQKEIFNGGISQVIMFSIDRFARNMIDGLVEIDRWQRHKIKITFVADALDIELGTWTGDIMMKFMVAFKLAMAEHERERIAVRQRDGIKAARELSSSAKKMKNRGATVEQIALRLRISPQKASRMIQKGGLYKGRPKGSTKASPNKVMNLIHRGLTIIEISAICNISVSTARRMINIVQLEEKERILEQSKKGS